MANPVVKTHYGEISGTYNERGDIAIFKGIPYAQPPVGELRWKPPRPAKPWSGTLEARKAGPVAIQLKAKQADVAMQAFLEGQGWGWRSYTVLSGIMAEILKWRQKWEREQPFTCIFL